MSIDAQFSREINRIPLLTREEEVAKFSRMDELKREIIVQINRTAGIYNKIPGVLFSLQDGYQAAKNFVQPHLHENIPAAELAVHVSSLLNGYKQQYEKKVISGTVQDKELLDTITNELYFEKSFIDSVCSSIMSYSGNDPIIDLHISPENLQTVWRSLGSCIKEYKKLQSHVTNANLRLVLSIAHQYYRPEGTIQLSDLVQEGSIGLVKATERFDVSTGNKFSTVGTWWIRQSIIRYLQNNSRTIRLPVNMQEHMNRALREYESFVITYRRQPTDKEMAQRLGISEDRYYELKQSFGTVCSLDAPASEGDDDGGQVTLADILHGNMPNPENAVMEENQLVLVQRAMEQLNEFERTLMEIRFGLNDAQELTHGEIAERFGVTRATIYNQESFILKKLRRILQNLG